jgi:hypothetical protein
VPERIYRFLDEKAQRHEVPVSEVLRRMLRRQIALEQEGEAG